jgi:hypothetical protein
MRDWALAGFPFRVIGFFRKRSVEKIPQDVKNKADISARATGPCRRGLRIVFIVGCVKSQVGFG